jgi:hypothetical protein
MMNNNLNSNNALMPRQSIINNNLYHYRTSIKEEGKISLKHYRYMAEAVLEAKKSPLHHKHGSVIVCNGKIMGRGYNHLRSTSSDGLIHNCCSCHAEIAALRSLANTCRLNTCDHRYWVLRRKVSSARKKGYRIHCAGDG